MPSPTRREFLSSTAVACAAWAAAAASAEETELLPIIDTHQHLWDLDRFRLPWVEEGTPLARSYVLPDYRQAAEGLNIVKTVYMEVDVDPVQQDDEIAYVSELCRDPSSGMAAAVVSGRPASDDFAKYLKRHRDNPHVRGLRQVLHVPSAAPGFCLQKEFIRGIRLLGEIGWSFDLCIRTEELPDFIRLVDECPQTRFVLDHCGNEPLTQADHGPWRDNLQRLAERANVIAKISGVIASAKPGEWNLDNLGAVVNQTWDAFGEDRVVFGGDWPVCTLSATLAEWVGALRQIIADRSESAQRKLLHDNAAAFYRL